MSKTNIPVRGSQTMSTSRQYSPPIWVQAVGVQWCRSHKGLIDSIIGHEKKLHFRGPTEVQRCVFAFMQAIMNLTACQGRVKHA